MAKKKKMVAAGRIKSKNEMKADPNGSIFAGGTQLDKKHFQDVGIAKTKDAIRAQDISNKITRDGGDPGAGSVVEAISLYSEEQAHKKAGLQYGPTHTVQDRATDRSRVVDRRV